MFQHLEQAPEPAVRTPQQIRGGMSTHITEAESEALRVYAMSLTSTAYHEAGHAVMALVFGRSFRYVTAQPDETEECRGFIQYPKRRPVHPFQAAKRQPKRCRNEIMIALAGGEAERMYLRDAGEDPGMVDGGDATDLQEARSRAEWLISPLSAAEREVYLESLRLRTCSLLEVNWHLVHAVAEALQECDRLTAAQVAEIAQQWNAGQPA
jgi:hypothetical protein